MQYTREEIEEKAVAASGSMSAFYNQDFVNYKGTTKGGKPYTEIVSEWLLKNYVFLSGKHIKKITRKSSYRVDTHDGIITNPTSNRKEELTAMELKRNGFLPPLGRIIDYQTPLKSRLGDAAGKIDLLSYDDKSKILRLLELKKQDSDETLLRSILEIYTYSMIVDASKLKLDFGISDCKEIRACTLFYEKSRQYTEYTQMKKGLRPMLHDLIQKLEIELIILSESSPRQANILTLP